MDFELVLCEKCGRMYPYKYCPDCGAKLQMDEKDRERKFRAERRKFVEPKETKSPWEWSVRGLAWEIATDTYMDIYQNGATLKYVHYPMHALHTIPCMAEEIISSINDLYRKFEKEKR